MNESHALRRLLRFLWQFRLWLLISLLCAFISVLFSVIAPLLIGRIIDGITSVTVQLGHDVCVQPHRVCQHLRAAPSAGGEDGEAAGLLL